MDKLEQMVQMYAYHYETFRTLYFSNFFDSQPMLEFKKFLEEPNIHYVVVYPVFKTYLRIDSKLSNRIYKELKLGNYEEYAESYSPYWLSTCDKSRLFEVRAKVLEEMLVEFKKNRG